MSPHDIEVLLHHHCTYAKWRHGDTPAYLVSIQWLKENELIEHSTVPLPPGDHSDLITTQRGKALVLMLCATPLPTIRTRSVFEYNDPRDPEWKWQDIT